MSTDTTPRPGQAVIGDPESIKRLAAEIASTLIVTDEHKARLRELLMPYKPGRQRVQGGDPR